MSEFKSAKSLEDHIVEHLDVFAKRVPHIQYILAEAVKRTDILMAAPTTNKHSPYAALSRDQLLAMMLFTFELFSIAGDATQENFYAQANNVLADGATSDDNEIAAWKTFFHFLQSALNALPLVSAEQPLYVASTDAAQIKSQYTKDQRVTLTGYISASPDLAVALKQIGGKTDGVILCITGVAGRAVSGCSFFNDADQEVLLGLRTTLLCTNAPFQDDAHGCWRVDCEPPGDCQRISVCKCYCVNQKKMVISELA